MSDTISRKAAMDAFMGKPPGYYHTSYIVGELNSLPSVNAEKVIHCKDCRFCFELGDFQMPWRGAYDEGFYCVENGIRYYPPHYSARTFYCGDAKKREEESSCPTGRR